MTLVLQISYFDTAFQGILKISAGKLWIKAKSLVSIKLGGMVLNLEKKIERLTLLIRLDGELDMHTASALRQAIDSEIEKRGIRTVILNLQGVRFVDSSGLGVILGRYKKLLPVGGKLKITNVPPHIYKIMELSGLPKIISFYVDEAHAYEEGRGA
ncbi:anti-sigma F factor antagonist [Desulfosporosinus youngiae DSM 17734]|uniref:Anti-sigma F factor antagonist n=1 Tax=Desulfosporosinus youngiae DSM 17734 TaxID=768710 RepID=H5XT26_9FIRM|nr:anti-sigma F factor antagonist [Desulfosporosinus youngiae DSM 17734]